MAEKAANAKQKLALHLPKQENAKENAAPGAATQTSRLRSEPGKSSSRRC